MWFGWNGDSGVIVLAKVVNREDRSEKYLESKINRVWWYNGDRWKYKERKYLVLVLDFWDK